VSLNKEALAEANDHDPRQPGKFEGEDRATVYFHTLTGTSSQEQTIGDIPEVGWIADVFKVDDEEAREFDISTPYYVVRENDQGFVEGFEADEKDLEELEDEAEEGDEEDEEDEDEEEEEEIR
jgi:hypothetical protein